MGSDVVKELFNLGRPPLLAAPMAGITDDAYRRIIASTGVDLTFTQMVSAEGLSRGTRKSMTMLEEGRGLSPWAVQLFGGRPQAMAKAAALAEEAGYQLVDINMGCPVPKVYKKGAGAALLEDVDRAFAVAQAVVSATSLPVSAKLRLGPTVDNATAFAIIPGLRELGFAFITVHARYSDQGYYQPADWEMLSALKKHLGDFRIVGNGDVLAPEDGSRMLAETGVDGIMVGRGMLGNPWIFSALRAELSGAGELPRPTPGQRVELIRKHLRLMVDVAGERVAIRDFRKHLVWYLRAFPGAASLRERAVKVKKVGEVEEILEEYVAKAEDGGED